MFERFLVIFVFIKKLKLGSTHWWVTTPYWLKGAEIGAVIGIILGFLPSNVLLLAPLIAVAPLTLVLCSGEFCNNTPHFIAIILVIIGCSWIGIITGWIYEKLNLKKFISKFNKGKN